MRQAQLREPHSEIQVELGLILKLAKFSTLIRIHDRARVAQNPIWEDAQTKLILGGRGNVHNLLMGGTIGVGTPHNIERT